MRGGYRGRFRLLTNRDGGGDLGPNRIPEIGEEAPAPATPRINCEGATFAVHISTHSGVEDGIVAGDVAYNGYGKAVVGQASALAQDSANAVCDVVTRVPRCVLHIPWGTIQTYHVSPFYAVSRINRSDESVKCTQISFRSINKLRSI